MEREPRIAMQKTVLKSRNLQNHSAHQIPWRTSKTNPSEQDIWFTVLETATWVVEVSKRSTTSNPSKRSTYLMMKTTFFVGLIFDSKDAVITSCKLSRMWYSFTSGRPYYVAWEYSFINRINLLFQTAHFNHVFSPSTMNSIHRRFLDQEELIALRSLD